MSVESDVRSREGRREENSRCLHRMEIPRHHRTRAPSCSLSTVRASFHFDKCVNGFNACRETHQTSDISILVTRDYPRECWSPLPLSRFQNVFSVTYVYDSVDALPYQRASILSPPPFCGYAFLSVSSRCFSPHRFLHKARRILKGYLSELLYISS